MIRRVFTSPALLMSHSVIRRSVSYYNGQKHSVSREAARRSHQKGQKHAAPVEAASKATSTAKVHHRQLHDTQVLFQDEHCLVLSKPAGLLALPDQTDEASLLRIAEAFLAKQRRGGGKDSTSEAEPEFLGPCHRLDAPVSGCMLFARTPEAAKQFAAQFRRKGAASVAGGGGALRKTYLCVVAGLPPHASGRLQHWLDRAEDTRLARRVRVRGDVEGDWAVAARLPPRKSGDGAFASVAAALDYQVRAAAPDKGLALLEVTLLTGRRHQIRAQLAHVGLPVLGDPAYFTDSKGKTSSFGDAKAANAGFAANNAIALHAAALSFPRPGGGGHGRPSSGQSYSMANGRVYVTAPVPKLWRKTLGSDFAGVVQQAMDALEAPKEKKNISGLAM